MTAEDREVLRVVLAAVAMHALVNRDYRATLVVKAAVEFADELLAELEKKP